MSLRPPPTTRKQKPLDLDFHRIRRAFNGLAITLEALEDVEDPRARRVVPAVLAAFATLHRVHRQAWKAAGRPEHFAREELAS